MGSNCDHEKVLVTDADGDSEICPICDDVRVETLDDGDST